MFIWNSVFSSRENNNKDSMPTYTTQHMYIGLCRLYVFLNYLANKKEILAYAFFNLNNNYVSWLKDWNYYYKIRARQLPTEKAVSVEKNSEMAKFCWTSWWCQRYVHIHTSNGRPTSVCVLPFMSPSPVVLSTIHHSFIQKLKTYLFHKYFRLRLLLYRGFLDLALIGFIVF